MALQLLKGYLALLVDYGSGTTKIHHFNDKVDDGGLHKVEIILNPTVSISLYFLFYSHCGPHRREVQDIVGRR